MRLSSTLRASASATLAAIAALTTFACDGTTGTDEEDATATSYGSMIDRLSPADLDRWLELRARLYKNFSDVCGDTFCGGDYSNLTSVSLDCSATKAGTVNSCTWVFGGSIEYVDGATGSRKVDARSFVCPIAVHMKAGAFLDTLLDETDSIRVAMPSTDLSFYDGVADCFAGVVGKPPPAATGTAFQELVDYMNDTSDFFPWWQARKRINKAFDDACGDSFCEGDYTDIAPLALACSVDKANAKVTACSWSFVGNYSTITTKGKVSAHVKKWICEVPVDAPADAFVAALSGADPLHTPLPGKQTTLNDALIDCL